MGEQTFYEISAQVLPVLWVAVVLEIRAIVRLTDRHFSVLQQRRSSSNSYDKSIFERKVNTAIVVGNFWGVAFGALGFVFVGAEGFALAVVFHGDNWRPLAATVVVIVGLALLLIAAATAPFVVDQAADALKYDDPEDRRR